MKKTLTFVFLTLFVWSYGQDDSGRKFQLGVSYAVAKTNKEFKDGFSNPVSAHGSYQLKQWGNIGLNAGLNLLYYNSKVKENRNSNVGFNPNISSSYAFYEDKMRVYFGLGYYYDSYRFTSVPDITNNTISALHITSGVTLNPGVRYFVHPAVFIDANATIIQATTRYHFGFSKTNNSTLFNIGMGLAF